MKNISFFNNRYMKIIIPVLMILLLSFLAYHIGFYGGYTSTISGI